MALLPIGTLRSISLVPAISSSFASSIIQDIAGICHLNFFSTEIVLDRECQLVAVDYVNDSCDLRLKSCHADGVPDEVVHQIAERIAEFAQGQL